MIHSITCDKDVFNSIDFTPGYNVVVSDITEASTSKDSRNGTGKTTLIEIMHFCLGSNLAGILKNEVLADWTFTVTLDLAGKQYNISRNTRNSKFVIIEGDIQSLNYPKIDSENTLRISNRDWTQILEKEMFGLDEKTKYAPSARSLLSYFIRRMSDWKGNSYVSPFENYPKQLEWDIQVNNSFLLGLNWIDASKWQILRDRERALKQVKKEIKAGNLPLWDGKVGDLEASNFIIEKKADALRKQIKEFKVHPEYKNIQEEANVLTKKIHDFTNEAYNQRSILSIYEESISKEIPPETDAVLKLYEAAGVELPSVVIKQLSEIMVFHNTIIKNRHQFLKDELDRISQQIKSLDEQIEITTNKRAEKLEILNTHGALEEFSKLQRKLNDLEARSNEIKTQVKTVKKIEESKTSLKIDFAVLEKEAKRSFDELNIARNKAIELFNANSEALYDAPGKLIIDVTERGFKFNIDIERLGSTGVGNMNTYCYDLVIAELWSDKKKKPGFLVHDSNILDGVDSRQKAHAIELAERRTNEYGFQYIGLMNSDVIPEDSFSSGFGIEKFIRKRLRDDDYPRNALLGIKI